jgi:hypothetical protein
MAIADDFTVAVNGDIRHTSGTANYTVLELHRFLQGLADDQEASGNDLVDITSPTPSDRATDNIITLNSPYNIDDDAAENLYNGSITQNGGDEVYSGLQILGAVNNTSTQIMVMQDTNLYQFTPTPASPFWGDQSTGGYNGNAAAGILAQFLVKSRVNGVDINQKKIRCQARHWGDTYDFFDVTLGTGISVAALGTTPDPQNDTAQATVTLYADVLNSGGTANAPTGGFQTIDLGNGAGAQPYYSKWTFGAQPDGLKALWEYTKDLTGNGTAKTTDGIAGEQFIGITHELDYDAETGGPFQERELLYWGTEITYDTLVSGPFTVGNLVTIGTSGASGRVLDDDGVSQLFVALDDTSITLLNNDVITEFPGPGAAATTTTAAINVTITDNDKGGGSGILLALEDLGTTGNLWIQLTAGVAPVDNLPIEGATSGARCLLNTAPTIKTVPKVFTGSYTGNYIGAYGVGIDDLDLTSSDTIEDLLNVTQTPPNNVTFTVSALVAGDRVLVGPRTAGILDLAQDTIAVALTGATETAVVMTTAIPTDTPATGTIRIQLDTGIFRFQSYTSYTGSTYTIPSTNYTGANTAAALNDQFISYIDEATGGTTSTFTTIFLAPRDLLVRVRDGGATPIKTFEGNGQLESTGGSIAAIRQSDA